MANIDDFIEKYKRGNRVSPGARLGAGLAGLGAAMQGKAWTNPNAQGGEIGGSDLMNYLMMEKVLGNQGQQGGQQGPPGMTSQQQEALLAGPAQPYYTPMEGSMVKKFVGEHPVSKMKRDIFKSGETTKQGFQKQQAEMLSKRFGEAGRVVGAFMGLEGYGKASDEVKLPNALKQLIQDKQDLVPYLKDEWQNAINPVIEYVGQRVETTVGGLPIWSGQARYVRDLAREISKTVSQAGMSRKNRQGLSGQSIRNILTLVYATVNGQLSASKLRDMGIDPESTPELDEDGRVVLDGDKLPNALREAINLTPEQEEQIEEAIIMMRNAPAIRGGIKDKKQSDTIAVKELAPGYSSDEWEEVVQ